MARYLEALRKKGADTRGMAPTKPTKPGSVSFVSSPSGVVRSKETIRERIRYAHSEVELDGLVEEIQAGFEAGELTQEEAEDLAWLVMGTARQLAQGLVNVPVGGVA